MSATTTTELTMTQHVPAPPEQVYAAWTEPERLASWWWPQLAGTTYDLDATVGGEYRIVAGQAGFGVHGRYVALDAPRRIEMTWVWEDGDDHGPEERVVVDLAPVEGGTEVTVRHWVAQEGAEDFRRGWTDCLERLGLLAA